MRNLIIRIRNLKSSKLFRDSASAILGNGIGNALLLTAGIIIARMLGKDLYGEYGLVKTTMLYIGVFASFGLGTTATKFIASALNDAPFHINSLINDILLITFIFSSFLSILLLIFADSISIFLEDTHLAAPLRFLGPIIIVTSINKAQNGILGGFKKYKIIATNNIVSSFIMLALACSLTYYYGLWGALFALLISQIINAILNFHSIQKLRKRLLKQQYKKNYISLIKFSFPIALQDFSYTLTNWGGSLIIVKFSSLGQLGIFTASSQWQSIVLMIPALLVNVILSHLSSASNDNQRQTTLIKKLICFNLLCTAIPFIIICFAAPYISKLYGTSFSGMTEILRVLIFSSIFMCCSNVFNSTLISRGKNWILFSSRIIRDLLLLSLTYYLIIITGKDSGAMDYAIASVITSIIHFLIVGMITFRTIHIKEKN